jgi:hypothetical protein
VRRWEKREKKLRFSMEIEKEELETDFDRVQARRKGWAALLVHQPQPQSVQGPFFFFFLNP